MANDTKEKKAKKTGTASSNTSKTKSGASKPVSKKTAPATKKAATKKVASKNTTSKTKSASTASSTKKTAAKSTTKKSTATKTNNTKNVSTSKNGSKKTSSKTAANKKSAPKKNTRVIEEIVEIAETKPEIVKEKVENKKTEKTAENASTTILGEKLVSGNEEEARRLRKKSYSKDALMFATIIPILDLFAMLFIDAYKPILLFDDTVSNYVITLILDFVLIYIVTYLIDFVMGEDAAKKNNK
ncbi:MAG TPA: hypothetical protein DCY94_04480 [Firmicutes bacterium]|nr:hypothetical protein [Bacillota bacterium]